MYTKKLALDINPNASFIIDELKKRGFQAYIVGGCVRDSVMNKKPKDWDITTDATPIQMMEIFEKTIPTGLEHGTVTIVINNEQFETTTFRLDGEYKDLRRPENVVFSSKLEDDLSRRDFTVNAMAYNDEGLVDVFDGIGDIGRKLIKAVGDPDKRFNEDALRIMRAIRFSSKLGFDIDYETFESMKKNSKNLNAISKERINHELEEIIENDISKLGLLNDIDVYEDILGIEFCKHTIDKINNLGKNISSNTKRAILFKNIDIENIKSIMKTIRYSNKDIDETIGISNVLRNYLVVFKKTMDLNISNEDEKIRIWMKRLMRYYGVESVKNSIIPIISEKNKLLLEKNINETVCFDVINDIIESGQCFSIPQLCINGRDLIENDIAKGKQIGDILDFLCDYIIVHPGENEKENLIKISKNNLRKMEG